MNYNILSPYVRFATHSILKYPFVISERIILDYELIFVESGGCLLTLDGKTYECVKNDVIFIRPGIEHKFKSNGESDFYQPHVHFDLCYENNSEDVFICFETYKNLSEKSKKLLRRDIVDIDIPPVIKLNNPQYFKTQLYDLINAFADKDRFSTISCKEKMLGLLNILFKEFDTEKNVLSSNNDIRNIKKYIDGNFMQKISLTNLSLNFYMNKCCIEKKFKDVYGITVIKYYHTIRFNASCKMLSEGMRINDIANKLNFESIYTFSRFFKNFCGMSPSEWRKNNNL